MANIFQDYTIYSGIQLDQLDIGPDSIMFQMDEKAYRFHYHAVGANFSRLEGISSRLNIYTQSGGVYYIESVGFAEEYDLSGGIGSHFLSSDYILDLHVVGSYEFKNNQDFGIELMQLLDWRQTDLNFYYRQGFWTIGSIKAGLGIHYLAQNLELSNRYSFPDEELSFHLDSSIFQTAFIEPGISFQAGNFYIHQGIRCHAVILTGKQAGVAYQIRPFISLDYKFF